MNAAALWIGRALALAAALLALHRRDLSGLPSALLLSALLVRAVPAALASRLAPERVERPRRGLALALAAALLAAALCYGGAAGKGFYFFLGEDLVDFDAMNIVNMERPPPRWESVRRAIQYQHNRFLPELTHEWDRFDARRVHLLNLGLWVGASFGLGALVLRLTGRAAAGALAAALAAANPSQVGTVLWVHGRQDLTAAFFILGTLALYAWGRGSRALYALAALSALAASFCKETALMTPALLAGLERILPGEGSRRRSALRLLPFLLIAGVQAYLSFVVFAFQAAELRKASVAVVLDAVLRQLPRRFWGLDLLATLWGVLPATFFLACAAGATRRDARADRTLLLLLAALVLLAPTHHLLNYPKHVLLPSLFLMGGAAALAVSGAGPWNAARTAVLAAALLFASWRENALGVREWLRKNGRAEAVLDGFEKIRAGAPAGTRFLFLSSRNAELMVNLFYRPEDRDVSFSVARVNPDLRFEWVPRGGLPYKDYSRPLRLEELELGGKDVILAPALPDGAFMRLNERLLALREPLSPDAETRAAAALLADPAGWRAEGMRGVAEARDAGRLRLDPAPRHATFLSPEVRAEPRAVEAVEAEFALAPQDDPMEAVLAHERAGVPLEGLELTWTTAVPGDLEPPKQLVLAPIMDGARRVYRFEVRESPVWLAGGTVTGLRLALQRDHAWAEFRGARLVLARE